MSAAAGDGIDPRYMQAVRALTAEFACLRGDRSVESCGFPPGFTSCLDPKRHGQNTKIETDITSMSEWIALEEKFEGTGILTKPGSRAPDWKYVSYIFGGSFAPWDRHNNDEPYRLNIMGNFAQFSINSLFMLMKSMLVEADFTPTIAHVILMNKILWVDCVVSKGMATWALDSKTKKEYKAMAWYQLGEVKNLIKAIADRCDYLIAIVFYGQKAKDSLLGWAINTFTERGIYLQPEDASFEHPQNIGLRWVHPDNAIDMVNIFSNIFAVTGVVVPHLSAEAQYEFLPTMSSVSEVEEIMRMQYTDNICLARQKIVELYDNRDKSPHKPRKSKEDDDDEMEENGDEEIIQQLYVRLPSNKTIVICDIDGAETIAELKKRIDWAWDGFDLVYEMNVLDDVECIGSYDIMSGEYIRVMARRG